MKKKLFPALIIILLTGALFFLILFKGKSAGESDYNAYLISDTTSITLRKGDILARPNWDGMPGSWAIRNGRRYGHAALVTAGATGRTVEEALSKASVVEAVFFDQGTREFQFDKADQIKERKAIISFGRRFNGIRYRLRMDLTDQQIERMIKFAREQADGGYNILSLKRRFATAAERESALDNLKNRNWHCATIIWEAFYLSSDTDIDENGGMFIYPSDIIARRHFDLPGGRICF